MGCEGVCGGKRKYIHIIQIHTHPRVETTSHFGPFSLDGKSDEYLCEKADAPEELLVDFIHIIEPSITLFTFKMHRHTVLLHHSFSLTIQRGVFSGLYFTDNDTVCWVTKAESH